MHKKITGTRTLTNRDKHYTLRPLFCKLMNWWSAMLRALLKSMGFCIVQLPTSAVSIAASKSKIDTQDQILV